MATVNTCFKPTCLDLTVVLVFLIRQVMFSICNFRLSNPNFLNRLVLSVGFSDKAIELTDDVT